MEEKKAFEPIFSFTLILLISKYSFSFDGCASFVFWFWRDEEERRKGLTLQELWWKSIVLSKVPMALRKFSLGFGSYW